MPPRRYTDLQAGKAGIVLAIESPAFGPGAQPGQGNTVHRYDLKSRKSDVAISGVGFFEIAQSGEKMLYRQGEIIEYEDIPEGTRLVARVSEADLPAVRQFVVRSVRRTSRSEPA